jgi:hypothetical protein
MLRRYDAAGEPVMEDLLLFRMIGTDPGGGEGALWALKAVLGCDRFIHCVGSGNSLPEDENKRPLVAADDDESPEKYPSDAEGCDEWNCGWFR